MYIEDKLLHTLCSYSTSIAHLKHLISPKEICDLHFPTHRTTNSQHPEQTLVPMLLQEKSCALTVQRMCSKFMPKYGNHTVHFSCAGLWSQHRIDINSIINAFLIIELTLKLIINDAHLSPALCIELTAYVILLRPEGICTGFCRIFSGITHVRFSPGLRCVGCSHKEHKYGQWYGQ